MRPDYSSTGKMHSQSVSGLETTDRPPILRESITNYTSAGYGSKIFDDGGAARACSRVIKVSCNCLDVCLIISIVSLNSAEKPGRTTTGTQLHSLAQA